MAARRRPALARPDRDELLPRPQPTGRRARRSSSTRAATRPRSGSRSPRSGATLRRDPAHARPLRPHRRRSPTSPRERARRSSCPRASWTSSRAARTTSTPPGISIAAVRRPSDAARGRRDASRLAGISFEVRPVPGHSPGAPRLLRRRRASSPATSSSPARSAAPTSRSATGTTLLELDPLARRRLSAGDGRLLRATARRRRSAPSSRATRSSPSSRAS